MTHINTASQWLARNLADVIAAIAHANVLLATQSQPQSTTAEGSAE